MTARATAAESALLIETHDGLRCETLRSPMTIGRDRSCDVVIDHPTVSRHHATIERDGDTWRLVEPGHGTTPSQPVYTRRSSKRVRAPFTLIDGEMIRIGRVRAWFFAAGPPAGWQPPGDVAEAPADRGQLARCPRCQHVGFAPAYAVGLVVPCRACGADIAIVDSSASVAASTSGPVASHALCPACRTGIEAGTDVHECPGCRVRMHSACYRELGGCATYGCSHVDELREPSNIGSDALVESSTSAATPRRSRPAVMDALIWSSVGLPTFGVPAAIWTAAAMRSGADRMALTLGTLGVIAGVAASVAGWSIAFNGSLPRW